MRPLKGMIFVEWEPYTAPVTESGLHLARPEREGVPEKGKVVAIGAEVEDIKVDDYAYFSESKHGFRSNGKVLLPVAAKNVLAVRRA